MPSETAKPPLEIPVELTRILQELQELKKEVAGIHEHQPFVVPIRSLAPWGLEVVKEIPALVQVADEDYVATFFDTNIAMSGDSQEEAVDNLRALIADMFDSLEEDEGILGPEPARQLQTLRDFIRRGA